jgi:1-acyl-sn-glycerol-3-phosphate acyltransferase
VRKASPPTVAVRVVATVAVLVVAAAAVCVLPMMKPSRRARVVRTLARTVLRCMGISHRTTGRLPKRAALLAANHVSWLDILVLLAHAPARILAKREVAGWVVVGALARSIGTVFIDRARPRTLPGTVAEVAEALRQGAVVAVFPEGTTWCGRSSGPFRPAMFQAAIDAGVLVSPVTLRFFAESTPTTVAAFLGDDTVFASFRRVVATRGVSVCLTAHPALHPGIGASRRALARATAAVVHPGWPAHQPPASPVAGLVRAATLRKRAA